MPPKETAAAIENNRLLQIEKSIQRHEERLNRLNQQCSDLREGFVSLEEKHNRDMHQLMEAIATLGENIRSLAQRHEQSHLKAAAPTDPYITKLKMDEEYSNGNEKGQMEMFSTTTSRLSRESKPTRSKSESSYPYRGFSFKEGTTFFQSFPLDCGASDLQQPFSAPSFNSSFQSMNEKITTEGSGSCYDAADKSVHGREQKMLRYGHLGHPLKVFDKMLMRDIFSVDHHFSRRSKKHPMVLILKQAEWAGLVQGTTVLSQKFVLMEVAKDTSQSGIVQFLRGKTTCCRFKLESSNTYLIRAYVAERVEYWLANVVVLNVMNAAGVHCTYWTPPIKWKPRDKAISSCVELLSAIPLKNSLSGTKQVVHSLLIYMEYVSLCSRSNTTITTSGHDLQSVAFLEGFMLTLAGASSGWSIQKATCGYCYFGHVHKLFAQMLARNVCHFFRVMTRSVDILFVLLPYGKMCVVGKEWLPCPHDSKRVQHGWVSKEVIVFRSSIDINKREYCVNGKLRVQTVDRQWGVIRVMTECFLGLTLNYVVVSVPPYVSDSPFQVNKDSIVTVILSKVLVAGWKSAWVDNRLEYCFGCGNYQHCGKINVVLSGNSTTIFDSSFHNRIYFLNHHISFTSSLLCCAAVYLGFSTSTRNSQRVLKLMRSSNNTGHVTTWRDICFVQVDIGMSFKHLVNKYLMHILSTMRKLIDVAVFRRLWQLRQVRVHFYNSETSRVLNANTLGNIAPNITWHIAGVYNKLRVCEKKDHRNVSANQSTEHKQMTVDSRVHTEDCQWEQYQCIWLFLSVFMGIRVHLQIHGCWIGHILVSNVLAFICCLLLALCNCFYYSPSVTAMSYGFDRMETSSLAAITYQDVFSAATLVAVFGKVVGVERIGLPIQDDRKNLLQWRFVSKVSIRDLHRCTYILKVAPNIIVGVQALIFLVMLRTRSIDSRSEPKCVLEVQFYEADPITLYNYMQLYSRQIFIGESLTNFKSHQWGNATMLLSLLIFTYAHNTRADVLQRKRYSLSVKEMLLCRSWLKGHVSLLAWESILLPKHTTKAVIAKVCRPYHTLGHHANSSWQTGKCNFATWFLYQQLLTLNSAIPVVPFSVQENVRSMVKGTELIVPSTVVTKSGCSVFLVKSCRVHNPFSYTAASHHFTSPPADCQTIRLSDL